MRALRDASLLAKLLVPYLALLLLAGVLGTFVLVRSAAERGQAVLDAELAQRSLEARALAHDRELYVVEAATFAANVQGMGAALQDGDAAVAGRLLRSVRRLKPDLGAVLVVDARGRRVAAEGRVPGDVDRLVRAALAAPPGPRSALLPAGGGAYAVSLPVCGSGDGCARTGLAVATLPAPALLQRPAQDVRGDVTLFDAGGAALAVRGTPVPGAGGARPGALRRTLLDDGRASLVAPLALQGGVRASVAVALPTASVRQQVRADALRLASVLVLALLGVVVVGYLLSRVVLRQVRGLLGTVRRIERGDLAARWTSAGEDEIGELARGVNAMAEQLQADVATLESRVAERTAEVERLMQQRNDLFASLSHEFRTPLAVVRAEVGLLKDDPALSRDAGESLDVVQESAEQVLGLVNDVLDLARSEAGRLELHRHRTPVDDVVAPVARTLAGLAASAGHTAVVRTAEALPDVDVDPVRLRQVLTNLADNAVKYTPEGGCVELTADREGDDLVLRVADDGPGIPDDAADLLFTAFGRVPGRAPRPGAASTGLGLALSRRLAEAHGGTLLHRPRPGGGTVFEVRLPVLLPDLLPQQARPARRARALR